MSGQELVTLNVGGKVFTTRSSTLKQFPGSRLTRMLDGRDQEFKMVGGQIFVDRDGVLFSFILDFLRTHQLLLPTDFSDHLRLQREALFYELNPLVDLLNQEHMLQPRPALVEMTLLPLPPQRPSYHDLVFQCGSDSTTDNQTGIRYVSIKPDNRKLANGTNVLGLLIDTLLMEGFHLVGTRTVSSEDRTECYSFERIKKPDTLAMNKTLKSGTTLMPEQ
ncbi:potassium channel regulatory protein isoform X2 [Cervus elaphus]|uniref:potassium channel regulatory protein isoform X2 n=1 Tax=Cervus elaphus TaxID=9860 RepID=UPI001CC2BB00|nr:potassium channel regulatory protein isoform X2 [Cervus elaphus]